MFLIYVCFCGYTPWVRARGWSRGLDQGSKCVCRPSNDSGRRGESPLFRRLSFLYMCPLRDIAITSSRSKIVGKWLCKRDHGKSTFYDFVIEFQLESNKDSCRDTTTIQFFPSDEICSMWPDLLVNSWADERSNTRNVSITRSSTSRRTQDS